MYTSSNDLVAQVEIIRDRFIISNTKLPDRINREGVVFIGFADECHVRQSAYFFDTFVNFLHSMGDTSFFFLWLEASLNVMDASCGLSLHSLSDYEGPTNFVRVQKQVADRVLSGETWFVSSMSGRWAIYGEQYGSELAVFFTRDREASEKVRHAFNQILADAIDAANELGDHSKTDGGKAFNDKLVRNYRT